MSLPQFIESEMGQDSLEAVFNRSDLVKSFLKLINYQFSNNKLLLKAVTHRSFAHEFKLGFSYERLEFLGDTVLDLLISDYLIKNFEHLDEGMLSKFRSALVNENSLVRLSSCINLKEVILIGKGERKSDKDFSQSIIADVFEAMIGAIYLDSGIKAANNTFLKILDHYEKMHNEPFIDPKVLEHFDVKSRLQEITMSLYKETPEYLDKRVGDNEFLVEVFVKNRLLGSKTGRSKKQAQKDLAQEILEKQLYILEEDDYVTGKSTPAQ